MDAVLIQKTELRRQAAQTRDALPAAAREAAANALGARAFPLPLRPGVVVSGYMPLKSEVSPLPLMRALLAQGVRLALPVIAGRGRPLLMRAWAWGEPLAAGVWGIREPRGEAAELEPDILLVPLLAFDRAGRRLGYGAGYYDLTIARLRSVKAIVAVGVAFAAQEVAAVPATFRDAPLDLVLTEHEVIDLRRS